MTKDDFIEEDKLEIGEVEAFDPANPSGKRKSKYAPLFKKMESMNLNQRVSMKLKPGRGCWRGHEQIECSNST